MRTTVPCLMLLSLALHGALAADSVVVFNEIHYHPVTNEATNEWVELHNQMAIDIDLSAWSLTGVIGFTFAEGTIIPAGGYLVIASDPPALRTGAGITNVTGPFTGRLNNSLGDIKLRDRNDRLMDEVEYRDSGKWPIAPDGSGVTLAKRDRNSASAAPENWTSSVRAGGTPGGRNFPDTNAVPPRSLIAFNSLWRYEASGTDLGTAWRAPAFDDSAWAGRNNATLVSYWPFDGNATGVRGTSGTFVGAVAATTDRNGAAGGALAFSGASQYVQVNGGGGLNGAGAGTISLWVKWTGTQDADCCGTFGAVLARQGNGLFSDDIIALSAATPASARVVWRQSGGPAPVLITGTTLVGASWHQIAVTFSPGGSTLYVDGLAQGTAAGAGLNNNSSVALSIGAWAGDGAGFSTASIDDVAIWDQPLTGAQIAQLAAQTKAPLDFAAPESAVYFAGDGRLATNDDLRRTALPLGPTTYYFRNTFQFGDDPARTELKLDLAADDGAVFYLNGAEVHRQNMPAGAVNYSTLASSAVGDAPIVNGISLATTNLVPGANVLAVEVHQAAAPDSGMVFGAGLSALIAPSGPGPEAFDPGGLMFNEISAAGAAPFQIELINRGAEPLDVSEYVVQRSGAAPDAGFTLSSQVVPPGGFLVLSQPTPGFGAAPGDKLFLLLPAGRGVADAVEIHERPRARSPDGDGEWLTPNGVTPGASNSFVLHDEVVINEILYHAPPLQPEPATFSPTNVLVTISNLWRYQAQGIDLGTAWRAPDYDDSGWPASNAVFYAPTNFFVLPAPKNTFMPLTNSTGARIITFYFRTQFLWIGDTNGLMLALRPIVDDGAVFYLNGVEVYRLNMPATNINYGTLSTVNIGIPGYTGPVTIPAGSLVPGLNTLAVEVHQVLANSSDIDFGTELLAWNQLTPALPFRQSPEEWIELLNRTSNAVNLTGWRLDEAIDMRFPSNTMIPPGGYLVVAKDPAALLAKFPGIAVMGPFTNRLSHRGGRIVLKDAADNPADVVPYFDDGRWPEAPDAGGSSLELRDPRADNSAGEAWAASDERSRSSWRTYSYRGVAAASPVGPDGQWHEFVLGMLDAGEVWLDDISVIETPGTTPTNLIQNGTFDTGTNKWRIIGNHHGEVIEDPDQPGNKVLRLVATGGTEHMSNHGETTLAGNRDVVTNREYLISFRAKWIGGSRQLNTRLYFNRMARTTLLDAPTIYGTPGARNSTFAANIGPTYQEFGHEPAVPAAFAPVTVSVRAADPDGVAAVTLWWRVDTNAWTNVAMTPDATPSNASVIQRFSATLTGKAAGTLIQFYVQGTDALGATSTFPASGPDSRALCKVDDGMAATNGLHNIRLIVRTDDADRLHNNINAMSNQRIPCTMIHDEREIFYNVGVRLKGSEHSRTVTQRLGFDVNLHSEHLFRGIHRELGIDRSESTGFGQREMLHHQTLNHAGGLPTKYDDLIQVIAPRAEHTGSADLQLASYGDVFLDDQFKDGSDGTVFEYELIYQLNATDTGTPEGNKVPAPDSVTGTTIRNLGDDKEGYRWNFLIKNNEDRDDYSRIIPFCKTMELTGTNFTAQLTNYIDVDRWLRGVAVNDLVGIGDSYGGDGSQHNVRFYVRPGDGRVVYLPHDMDAFYDANRSIVPNNDLSKLIAVPAYARAYYCHLLDIIATTYNGTYMTRWANQFGQLLPAQPFASHLSFIVQRAGVVTSQVNSAAPNVPFAITTSGGNNFATSNNVITISGNAPLGVKEIEINGVRYPITWTGVTTWSLQIPLYAGTNLLAVQGLDRAGQRPASFLDTITVTNTGAGALQPVVINEWMADNAGPDGLADPADGAFQDWFELFNPNTNAVNLAGFFLTDDLSQPTRWQIPPGAIIPERGFLLVWADNQPFQYGSANNDLHAAFQLSSGGEAIGLFNPAGVAQHALVFGPQTQNVSQGLFPDGVTNSIYSLTNWTPRAANSLAGPLRFTAIAWNNGVVTLTWDALPGRMYRVQYKEALSDPEWLPLGGDLTAVGSTAMAMDTVPAPAHRFYRVRIVPD